MRIVNKHADMSVAALARAVKANGFSMVSLSETARNNALGAIAEALKRHSGAIFAANEADLAAGERDGLPEPIMKRLRFDDKKLLEAVTGIA